MSDQKGTYAVDRNSPLLVTWAFTDILTPPLVLSQATLQEKWQRDRNDWDALSKESWFLKQDEEPLNHLGKSILVRWLYPLEDKEQKGWRCGVPKDGESWCRKEIARIDRAIIHVRSDLGLEPYPCEGHCNIPNWYAEKPLPPKYPNIVTALPVSLQGNIVPTIIRDRT